MRLEFLGNGVDSMKNIFKSSLMGIAALLLLASVAHAQLGTSTGTTTLSVAVAAEAALTIGGGGTTSLISSGSNFSSYGGTTNLTYFIRTTVSGGIGHITSKVTADFSPAGGPSVATPPTAGDALTYTCSASSPGNNGTATPCTTQTSSTTVTTPVVDFGADARSLLGGNTASVAWTLTNDPKYKTGSYSATVTFTISAT